MADKSFFDNYEVPRKMTKEEIQAKVMPDADVIDVGSTGHQLSNTANSTLDMLGNIPAFGVPAAIAFRAPAILAKARTLMPMSIKGLVSKVESLPTGEAKDMARKLVDRLSVIKDKNIRNNIKKELVEQYLMPTQVPSNSVWTVRGATQKLAIPGTAGYTGLKTKQLLFDEEE